MFGAKLWRFSVVPCYSSLYSIRRTVHTRLAEKSASCSYIKPLFFVLLSHSQRSRTLWSQYGKSSRRQFLDSRCIDHSISPWVSPLPDILEQSHVVQKSVASSTADPRRIHGASDNRLLRCVWDDAGGCWLVGEHTKAASGNASALLVWCCASTVRRMKY